MEKKGQKKNFNIRFDEEMFIEISRRSKELQITETEFIRRAIKNSFKTEDELKDNTNKLLYLASMSNVYLEEILQNMNFDPPKLVKSIDRIKSSLNEFSDAYGIKL